MNEDLGQFHGFGGSKNRVVANSEQTGGSLAAVELMVPPRSGPPLHIHVNEDELFFVIEGETTFWIDGKIEVASQGKTAFVPRNVPHTFANLSSSPARLLAIFSPAGLEGFFEYGDPRVLGAEPNQQELEARFNDYSTRFNMVALGKSPLL